MKPGRELDELIHTKVMGKTYYSVMARGENGNKEELDPLIPKYSTDISAAWEVVRKLGGVDLRCGMRTCEAKFLMMSEADEDGNSHIEEYEYYSEIGEHAVTHAICLAALKACGVVDV